MFRKKKIKEKGMPQAIPGIIADEQFDPAEESHQLEQGDCEKPSEESSDSDAEVTENSDSAEQPDPNDNTEAEIEAYMVGSGVSRERIDEALRKMEEIAVAKARGGFDPACMEFILRGLGYEASVEKARMEGVIEGRNQQIAEAFKDVRAQKEREIPSFHGSPGIGSESRETTIFDLAKGAK